MRDELQNPPELYIGQEVVVGHDGDEHLGTVVQVREGKPVLVQLRVGIILEVERESIGIIVRRE